MTSEPRAAAWMARGLGVLVAVAGGVVLLGWLTDLEIVKRPLQDGATMKVNTAICFLLAGFVLTTMSAHGVSSRLGGIFAVALAAIAAATLCEYAFGRDLYIDQLLVTDASPSPAPGRMSPVSAACFVAFAVAVWSSRTPAWLRMRELLAIAALLASAVAVLGYAYDTRALYTVGAYTSMAPHTAVLMTLLSIGLLAQPPHGAAASVILDSDLGGVTARRILPWALATPVILGWLNLQGRRIGAWGPEFGLALVVISTMVIISAVVLTSARSLSASERAGRAANAELRELTRFRALLETAPDAMVITDQQGRVTLANQQAERLFQYTSAEFVGMRVDDLLPVRFRALHSYHRATYNSDPKPRAMGAGHGLWAVNKQGVEFPVEVSLSPLRLESGLLISTAIRDVTWRRELEADRRRFVYLAEQSQEFIGMCDTTFAPFYVNEAGRRLVGLESMEAALAVTVGDFFFPEDRRFIEEEFFPRVIRDGHGSVEIRFRHFGTGEAIWMNYRVGTLRDERGQTLGWSTISSDITARREVEAALRRSLQDKETLLREVHHRVKNNLAVIGSLLYLQSSYVSDPALRQVLQESQERVRSMALVHERLYRSRDVAEVDFAEYIRELSAELMRNHTPGGVHISLRFDMTPMTMDLDRAVLSGLILNEGVTNALKHAFPARHSGVILVGLQRIPDGFVLRVADDGIGLPSAVSAQTRKSLGMLLIHALASQLDGRVDFHDARPGTEMRLTVKDADDRNR